MIDAHGWTAPPIAPPPGPRVTPAGLLRRTGALLLDLLVLGLGVLVGSGILAALAGLFRKQTVPWSIPVAVSLLLLGAGPFVYFGFGWSRGATLGMRACHVRVVNDADGERLALPQVILRLTCAVYSVLFLLLGVIWIAIDRRRRGWHDHYAGSRVIHEPVLPFAGAGWAAPQWGPAGGWGPPPPPWAVAPAGGPPHPGTLPPPPPPPPPTWPSRPGEWRPSWAPTAPGWGPPAPVWPSPPAWPPTQAWAPAPLPQPPPVPPAASPAGPAPSLAATATQAGGNAGPWRAGWRALPTLGRAPWTWTDVVPLMLLFIPLLDLTGRLLAGALVRIQHGRPHGTLRAVDTVIVDLAAYVPALFFLFVLVGLRRHGHLRDLGLCRVNLRWIGAVIPFVLIAYVFEAATGVISTSVFPNTPPNQCRALSQEFGGYAVVALVTAVFSAPFVEELFFRGFLLRYLRGRMPIVWAVLLSSVIFSVAHFQYGQPTLFLPIFTVGLVLGAIYHYSGSIWPGVLTHATFNLVATIQLLLHPHC